MQVSLDWRDFPLDDISDAFSPSTRSVLRTSRCRRPRPDRALFGPLAKVLGEAYDGKGSRRWWPRTSTPRSHSWSSR